MQTGATAAPCRVAAPMQEPCLRARLAQLLFSASTAMGILDDAIRQHLDLKRQHGATESELKQLEDEAFGPPSRPGEPDFPESEDVGGAFGKRQRKCVWRRDGGLRAPSCRSERRARRTPRPGAGADRDEAPRSGRGVARRRPDEPTTLYDETRHASRLRRRGADDDLTTTRRTATSAAADEAPPAEVEEVAAEEPEPAAAPPIESLDTVEHPLADRGGRARAGRRPRARGPEPEDGALR